MAHLRMAATLFQQQNALALLLTGRRTAQTQMVLRRGSAVHSCQERHKSTSDDAVDVLAGRGRTE